MEEMRALPMRKSVASQISVDSSMKHSQNKLVMKTVLEKLRKSSKKIKNIFVFLYFYH